MLPWCATRVVVMLICVTDSANDIEDHDDEKVEENNADYDDNDDETDKVDERDEDTCPARAHTL